MEKLYVLFHKNWHTKKVRIDIVSDKQGIVDYIKKTYHEYNRRDEKWYDVTDKEINELFEKTLVHVKAFTLNFFITPLNANGIAFDNKSNYCNYE